LFSPLFRLKIACLALEQRSLTMQIVSLDMGLCL